VKGCNMKKISKHLLILALAALVLLGILISCETERGLEDIEVSITNLLFNPTLGEIIITTDTFVALVREDFKLEKVKSGSGTEEDPYLWEENEELFGPDGKAGRVKGEIGEYLNGLLDWHYWIEVAADKIEDNKFYRLIITKDGYSFIDEEASREDSDKQPFIRKASDPR
jgi:hypothetical protein